MSISTALLRLRQQDIGMLGLAALIAIQSRDGISVGDLAAMCGTEYCNASTTLSRLRTRGLITVTRGRPDRRVRRLTLTDAGRTLVAPFAEATP